MIAGWVPYEERGDETDAEWKLRHVEACRARLVAAGKQPGQAISVCGTERWDETLGRFVDIVLVEFE